MRLNVLSTFVVMAVVLAFIPGILAAQEYTDKGADNCLRCHRAAKWDVMDIFNTPHGSRVDPDAPFSNEQCESCHGPGQAHMKAKKKSEAPMPRSFGKDDTASVPEQNEPCLACHQSHTGSGWFGSAHESTDVACVSCHSLHESRDPIFDAMEQQEVCFDCHKKARSDIHKSSGHPLRFGSMSCSSCHDVHDGNNDFLLAEDNVNDTCYSCHAEKRGPFLFEHAPVTDSCTLCHQPHGSNHPALLTRRPPLLCQQCHSAAGHPALAFTDEDMDDSRNSRYLMAKGCMNCHSQVHGSNHPSGSSQIR